MTFTFKDWLAVAVSSLFAFVVFGNISTKAGFPRWHGLIMAIPLLNVIALMVFAFSTWPVENELLQLRLGNSGSTRVDVD